MSEPVLETNPDQSAAVPGVDKAASDGIRLVFTQGSSSRILASKQPGSPLDVLAIAPPDAVSTVAALCRLGRVTLFLETSGRLAPLHQGYAPSDGDVLVLQVQLSPADWAAAQRIVKEAAARYSEQALARYSQAGKKPVGGFLTIVARPPSPSDSGPVMFLLDGSPIAIINRAPYSVRWDTRDWSDGEHLIEARALGAGGAVLSSAKSLVFVRNGGGGG